MTDCRSPALRGTRAAASAPPSDQIVAPWRICTRLPERNRAPNALAQRNIKLGPTRTACLTIQAAARISAKDSSFLVIRQLRQDKTAFDTYVASAAMQLGQTPDLVAAKIFGRWPDGSSLVRNPEKPGGAPDNDFGFLGEDPDGLACPKGGAYSASEPARYAASGPRRTAHQTATGCCVSAAPYLSDSGTPDGTLFMCLNADIERQFEMVQQAWVQNTSFGNLRDEADPLTGSASRNFTIPSADGPVCLRGLPHFTTMLGGGYFWMPGKAAVQFLIDL